MKTYDSDTVNLTELYDDERIPYSLVIPEYQRSYLWKEEQFQKLFDNLLNNFGNLNTIISKTFFLGAIIFCKSNYKDAKTLIPYDVVDGQQRLTSLTLLFIILVKNIRLLKINFENDDNIDKEKTNWLNEEIKLLEEKLNRFIFCERQRVEDRGKIKLFMPRLIRQEDRRSIISDVFKYSSSISQVVQKYKKYLLDDEYEISLNDLEDKADAQTIKAAWKYFNEQIVNLNIKLDADQNDFFYNFVPFKYFNSDNFKVLFKNKDIDLNEFSTNRPKRLIRLILLGNFLLKRTYVSLIECREPNDAYDIFDTLNTSGLPLTALETLKPLVVLHCQNKSKIFSETEAFKYFNDIENTFGEFSKDTKKIHNETKKICVAAALLVEGEKLSEDLTEQRMYINKLQKKFERKQIPDSLVFYLSKIAEYRSNFFNKNSIKNKLDSKLNALNISENDAQDIKLLSTLFCNSNTHLIIPILTVLFIKCEKERNFETFISILKALSAFLILRRGVTGDAGGIDKCFREFMKGNSRLNYNGFRVGIDKEINKVNVNDLKKFLINKLDNDTLKFNLNSKKEWVNNVSQVPLYRKNKTIARFILLAAYHNSQIDNDENGLIKKSVPHMSRKFLSYNFLEHDSHTSIEHVAPESDEDANWKKSGIYDIPNLKHTLGNLALIPQKLNIKLSNHSWEIKKNIYAAISSSDENVREESLNKAKKAGLNLSKNVYDSLKSFEETSELLKGISDTNNWNASFVQKRSKRICELAWDELVGWLKL